MRNSFIYSAIRIPQFSRASGENEQRIQIPNAANLAGRSNCPSTFRNPRSAIRISFELLARMSRKNEHFRRPIPLGSDDGPDLLIDRAGTRHSFQDQ
jgi:hypothetical protein